MRQESYFTLLVTIILNLKRSHLLMFGHDLITRGNRNDRFLTNWERDKYKYYTVN